MGRVSTTHYNPALGVKYIIRNTRTNQTKIARTLGIHDKEYAPIRSNKDTPRGKEFFKMIVDNTIITFLNSINYDKCMSDNELWEFIGQRPDGTSIEKKNSNKSKEETIIEFASEDYKLIMGG